MWSAAILLEVPCDNLKRVINFSKEFEFIQAKLLKVKIQPGNGGEVAAGLGLQAIIEAALLQTGWLDLVKQARKSALNRLLQQHQKSICINLIKKLANREKSLL